MNIGEHGGVASGTEHPDPFVLFLSSFADCEKQPAVYAHLHQLRRAFAEEKDGGLGIRAVLCVDKRPAAYFKKARAFDAKREREWHRQVWNQGTAAMLIVEDRNAVRVYSVLMQPTDAPINPNRDCRLVEQLQRAAFVLEQEKFFRSIASGQYYQKPAHQSKFLSGRPIDEYLLDNLSHARDKLCDQKQTDYLTRDDAHAFLGRAIFTCYLLERGIIGPHHLQAANVPKTKTLRCLLEKESNNTSRIPTLYRLFRQLQIDFNGSLFGSELPGEQAKIRAWHIEVLLDFLRGSDVKAGQQVFPQLDLYDFRFIPIELISGIYEHFLAGEPKDDEAEDEDEEGGSKSNRREAGAYYTPPRLAELVVDIAVGDWPTLLGKRFLDPACGSGIFLVILFHRMAEEWRWRNPNANNIDRALKLRQFLIANFSGVDIDHTACMVACFSLYLAFMDQLEPRDIAAVNQELARLNAGKVLPPLISQDGNGNAPVPPVIRQADFFSADSAPASVFDLIIGNPPWKGRNQSEKKRLEQWLLSETKPVRNPYLEEWIDALKKTPAKAERKARFFPQDQSAIGFMWKAPIHARGDGQVCLLLPSRVVMSNDTDSFQAAWFSRFRMRSVWQLADYRRILFNGAICPAVIVHHDVQRPDETRPVIRYLTPKVDRLDPRGGTLPVQPEDYKIISVKELACEAASNRAFTVWKKHFWGTLRDRRVIDRLLAMPALKEITGDPGSAKMFVKGQGFKPFEKAKYKKNPEKYGEPIDRWWTDKHRFLNARLKTWDLVLLEADCPPIGAEWQQLHRSPNKSIFQPPMILINQGFTRVGFSDFPVLFRHAIQRIGCKPNNENLLLFLCAVLDSPLATYFYFHTSANWGIERDKVHLNELLLLPFPLPDDTDDPKISWEIVRQAADTLRTLRQRLANYVMDQERENLCLDAKAELTKLIYRYYDVSSWEQDLIRETVDVFKRSIIPSPGRVLTLPTLKETNDIERRDYAEYLCRDLNRRAHRQPWKLSASAKIDARGGLCLLTLDRDGSEKPYVETSVDVRYEKVLERLAEAARKQQTSISFLRGFYLVDNSAIHVLKPLAFRHWTKTAALNDGDQFWGTLLRMGGKHG